MQGLFLSVLASLSGAQAPSSQAHVPIREQPLAIEIGPTFIVARMPSNGCTGKKDFSVSIHRTERVTHLVFHRRVPDRCRAIVREGVRLRWTRAELGSATMKLSL